jgi:hypothetical protein
MYHLNKVECTKAEVEWWSPEAERKKINGEMLVTGHKISAGQQE